MSVDSEISLLKDTVWRLTGRVLVLENFISKTFGDVLDSSWSSTPKLNTGSCPAEGPLGSSNKTIKRQISRRGHQRSNIAKFAKKRKYLSSSILNSSDLSSEGRISVTKVSYEENPSDDEDEPSQQPTSASIKNGMEFATNKRIKLENVSNEDETSGDKNGLEGWDHSVVDEEEDRDSQNTSTGLEQTTATNYEQPPETKTCVEPLPPPEDLPFILRGDYFKVIKLDGVKVTGECQRCPDRDKIRGSTTSTTNFLTHIKRLHPEILKIYQSQRPIPGKRRSILPTRRKSKKDERLILGDQPSNSQSQLPLLNSSTSFTSNDLSGQNDRGVGVAAQSMVTTVTYNVV